MQFYDIAEAITEERAEGALKTERRSHRQRKALGARLLVPGALVGAVRSCEQRVAEDDADLTAGLRRSRADSARIARAWGSQPEGGDHARVYRAIQQSVGEGGYAVVFVMPPQPYLRHQRAPPGAALRRNHATACRSGLPPALTRALASDVEMRPIRVDFTPNETYGPDHMLIGHSGRPRPCRRRRQRQVILRRVQGS